MSSKLPPTFPTNFIRSKFTSFLDKSATANTALTAISANLSWYFDTTLDERAVFAALFKSSLLFLSNLISSKLSKAYLHALS